MRQKEVTRYSGSRLTKLMALCGAFLALEVVDDKETKGIKDRIDFRIKRHDIPKAFTVTKYDSKGVEQEAITYSASEFFLNIQYELLEDAVKNTTRKFTPKFVCLSRVTKKDGTLFVVDFYRE